jgi:hypothetical protein
VLSQELKMSFLSHQEGMLSRVEQVKDSLGSKIGRLGEMIDFSMAEVHSRTGNLMEGCQRAKKNSEYLSDQVRLIK